MKITLSSIPVADQDKALKFYTNVLGFVRKTDVPAGGARWLTVVSPEDPNGPELVLEPNAGYPAMKALKESLVKDGIPITAFQADDVQQEYARLKSRGVVFTQEPLTHSDNPTGPITTAVFDDTCGNLLMMISSDNVTTAAVAEIDNAPRAKAEMLIRKPVEDVFEAFVDPRITSKFWFSRGSGRLETGKQVTWHWDMHGFSVDVDVKAVEANSRILLEWPSGSTSSVVEWTFTSRPDRTTFVTINCSGFEGDDENVMREAIDSTEGFAFVLAGLKAFFEHGIELNLVRDRFPEGLEAG